MGERAEELGYTPTGITTIANGSVPELFEHALGKVLANIDDPNTEPKQKRTITIEFALTPDASRSAIEVVVNVKSKLASTKEAEGILYVARNRSGEPIAVENNIHQPELLKG